MKGNIGKWIIGLGAGVVLIASILIFKPVHHVFKAWKEGKDSQYVLTDGYADDISHLNSTPIDSSIDITSDTAFLVKQLQELVQYAKVKKLKISIAGAKHSMGGHTISPNGIRINMLPYKWFKLDTITNVVTVGTGAMWSDLIPYLNKYGRAVQIMQSDNAFSVGGSLSVNCHGWQHNKPPIASSVLSFRLLKPDGTLVKCSRIENKELFSLALGGYGLFGIILEVNLQTVPNEIYSYHRLLMSPEKYLAYYDQYIDKNKNARMVYGRLSVNKGDFLRKAMLNFFEYEKSAPANYPLSSPSMVELKEAIFMGTKDSDYGKELRWNSEQTFTKTQIGYLFSRNQIMNESPSFYLNKDSSRTDILHEYFIPRRNFNKFVEALQKIVPMYNVDLLNITIRNVYKDEDTYLRYAKEEVFAFVMFFNQAKTANADKEMAKLTVGLIEAAHALDGVYYLPYRLHANQDQLERCYPMYTSFVTKKLEYDPDELFSNIFWEKYKRTRSN